MNPRGFRRGRIEKMRRRAETTPALAKDDRLGNAGSARGHPNAYCLHVYFYCRRQRPYSSSSPLSFIFFFLLPQQSTSMLS
ncbi:hypothetical protein VNO80_09510 [Phaseolus coccineus]|uniref:Uncharacterized protein n=1 Tax=Phaseolus coccineus TaxID=3886 RepID=A0AAN9NBL3_PHACN